MYSQSKGRQFSSGEQSKLVEYLIQTCPLDPNQETEQDRKLNLILSKVQVKVNSICLRRHFIFHCLAFILIFEKWQKDKIFISISVKYLSSRSTSPHYDKLVRQKVATPLFPAPVRRNWRSLSQELLVETLAPTPWWTWCPCPCRVSRCPPLATCQHPPPITQLQSILQVWQGYNFQSR